MSSPASTTENENENDRKEHPPSVVVKEEALMEHTIAPTTTTATAPAAAPATLEHVDAASEREIKDPSKDRGGTRAHDGNDVYNADAGYHSSNSKPQRENNITKSEHESEHDSLEAPAEEGDHYRRGDDGNYNDNGSVSDSDKVHNEGEVDEEKKRHRPWNLGEKEIEVSEAATKKIKVDGHLPISPVPRSRVQPHPSPVFVTNGWPQRSPMDPKGGEHHRCQVDEVHGSINGSSSTPSSRSREQQQEDEHEHDEVAHALFTESFDTISACASTAMSHDASVSVSAMVAIQEPACDNADDDDGNGDKGMPSPRQKTNTPSRHGSYGTRDSSTARSPDSQQRYSPSLETQPRPREDYGSRQGRYHDHEDSPHSPPQRVIHVDGDDNGCGDISPIKFSPPTVASPSHPRDRDLHISRYPGGDYPYCQLISTPGNDSNSHEAQQHAAEVSFDTHTTAGNHSYRYGHGPDSDNPRHQDSNTKADCHDVSRTRRAEDGDVGSPSYSASTLSEAKTPPRRGTSGAYAGEHASSRSHNHDRNHYNGYAQGHHYDRVPYHGGCHPLYSVAPPIPRDFSHPHFVRRYPSHAVAPQGNHNHNRNRNIPPGVAATIQDPTRENPRHVDSGGMVRNNHPNSNQNSNALGKTHSSPIRPSRSSYPSLYREPAPRKEPPRYIEGPPRYIGGPWIGYRYAPEPRDYPPPRPRLPPHNSNNLHWNHNHNHNQRSNLPTPEIPTHGHPKGRRGISSVGPAPKSHNPPPPVPPLYHHQAPMPTAVPSATVAKDPFDLFRSVRKVFQGCSYLLYPAHMGVQWGGGHQIHTDPEDLKVARRRIESAICALGGYVKDIQEREQSPNTSPHSASNRPPSTSSSVFRRRMDYEHRNNASTLCSSSTKSDDYYLDVFHRRYFVGDQGISWEVEENPPVFVSVDEDDSIHNHHVASARVNGGASRAGMTHNARMNAPKEEVHSHPTQPPYNLNSHTSSQEATLVDHNQKMKYRCKLCGQPKQNHVCPYRKSLVRTLGVMVCPAVNAYVSEEPGVLTPALSDMNNFVPYGRGPFGDDSSDVDTDVSTQDQSMEHHLTPGGPPKRNLHHHHSPASSSMSTSPHSKVHRFAENQYSGHHEGQRGNLWQRKPRLDHQKPLFMTIALRPEHYRAVTPRTPYRNSSKADERDDKEEGSFEYPNVPLTFGGRKRLTDTLFYLSQRIPSVTADVASLLRMARERDEWDLAVAEVLTQVVVCIHCSDGDYQLNGLKNYLLKIGITS